MASTKCPECNKYIPASSDVCKYCGFPIRLITQRKKAEISKYIARFRSAVNYQDTSTALKTYGVLEFLEFKNLLWAKSEILFLEKKHTEALTILDGLLAKNPSNPDAVMTKLKLLAFEGKFCDYCQFLNKNRRLITDRWMAYWIEALAYLQCSKEEYKRYEALSESDPSYKHYVFLYETASDNPDSKAIYLSSMASVLHNTRTHTHSFTMLFSNPDVSPRVAAGTAHKQRMCMQILSILDSLFGEYGFFPLAEDYMHYRIGDKSYTYKLGHVRSQKEYDELFAKAFQMLYVTLNPFPDSFDSVASHIKHLIRLGLPKKAWRYMKEYSCLFLDEIKKGTPDAIEIVLDACALDMIPAGNCLYEESQKYASSPEVLEKKRIAISARSNLTAKSDTALDAAEWLFNKSKEEKDFGFIDAGSISLSYFKVLEIEYNDRLIIPLVESVSSSDVLNAFNLDIESLAGKKREKYIKTWERNVHAICAFNPSDPKGFELGTVMYILVGIKRYETMEIGKLLFPKLTDLLTAEGLKAFHDKSLINVISTKNVDRFRNPPAHTKYLEYATAVECREFVFENIPKLKSWFIQ